VSRRTRVESFGQLSRHSKYVVHGVLGANVAFEIVISRFCFWEIDQIWLGHKIGSFDLGIKTQSATESRYLSLTCAHIPTLRASMELYGACMPPEKIK
jgi:hypothetical protein